MNDRGKGLMILGAGAMQGPAIRIAKEMGLTTIVADGNAAAPCAALADRFEHIDLKDKEGIEDLCRSLQAQGKLAGIMTAGTDFSATVAWVAERLGLPGIPYEAALNASDKERMRRCFQQAGLPSPKFIILKEPPAPDYALPFAYPAVVKPVDNMGARGCRRVNGFEELKSAVEDALAFSRSSRAIAEEYMEGPEFSVDALVYNGEMTLCGLADRHIYFPPYFIEMGHTMPTAIDKASAEAILRVFETGANALGITNGAAKGDIKLTPAGPMIGEIAARLSGGYMSGWTYPYASGVSATKGAIQIALGRPPEGLAPKRRWTSAERAFISIPGKVRSIQGAEAAGAGEYVKNVFLRIEPGSRVRFPENNVTKCGNVITAAPDRKTAEEAAERTARSILIRLETPDDETEEFLKGLAKGSAFPPDAFALPDVLREALGNIPQSELSSGGRSEAGLYPFPGLLESGIRDYTGRTIAESLEAVRALTGRSLSCAERAPYLGREFWIALIRGGYQGAAYIADRLM
ncbi:MAG: ATP-grasp domain-containing protein [Spirochaetaceae bacterium]|jgi:biotin carboxylase|nr:ATP-grasp domain-containing protein [Spirochaetaceae bacterium]